MKMKTQSGIQQKETEVTESFNPIRSSIVSVCSCAMLLWLLVAGCAHPPLAGRKSVETFIPTIASVAKIQVGYSTQEDFERDWGPGKIVTGGHPNSGRLWRVRGTPCVLHGDGFEYSERGLVVDSLSISEDGTSDTEVPLAHLAAGDPAWLGEVSVGMPEAKVTEVLKRTGLPVRQTERGYETQAKGFHALAGSGSFQTWMATLGFRDGLLNTLQIDASQ